MSSTLIGNLPCNSGIKSDGFEVWKAPAPINRIWSVFIIPYLVFTDEPSIIGSKSLWTPSLEISGPEELDDPLAILSISSIKIMPSCSALFIALSLIESLSINFSASRSIKILKASLTLTFLFFSLLGKKFDNMSDILLSKSSFGLLDITCIGENLIGIDISISLSSSFPSLNIFLNFCLVSLSFSSLYNKESNIFSSAICSACVWIDTLFKSDSIFTEISTRSLTIDSTSLPTYPTSVNLDASILINGAFDNLASLLAISVLPTPVGPIIRIFFGDISSFKKDETFCLLHLFLKAIETAFFASDWPIIYLSSSETVSRGVNNISSILIIILLL